MEWRRMILVRTCSKGLGLNTGSKRRSVWLTNGNHGEMGKKEENGEITFILLELGASCAL